MKTQLQLQMKKFPQAIADLTHSNQFLKMSAFSAYIICGLLITLLFFQMIRPTRVLTLAPDANLYQQAPKPKPEIEIERAIREYIKYRYNWEPKTVAKRIDDAEAFILPGTRKTFAGSMANVVRFSTEKMVGQKAYAEKVIVDLGKNEVRVTGDRVTSIQGIKAAGDLSLKLSFESGPRTEANPWGIYIQKELEGN